MDVVRTKLEPPPPVRNRIERPQLLNRLKDVSSAKITLVQAPAGYGKTTLLVEWHWMLQRSGQACAWLTVDGTEYDAVSLLGHIVASLRSILIDTHFPMNGLLEGSLFITTDAMVTLLVNELEQYGKPVFLFLDDLHLARPAAQTALQRLIDSAPENVHCLLSTRTSSGLQLARLRARGLLLELGIDDLRLSRTEAQTFMLAVSGVKLADPAMSRLDERTEGWAAGIKLASLALRGDAQSVEALNERLASFSGDRTVVSDFFAEEVLANQPVEVRDFLLLTSPLDRFCPELCSAVTGYKDARRLIDLIEQSGLFLLHLDERRSWYRYHHLFAEFLQRRLSDERSDMFATVHRRASEWYWNCGMHFDAIEHALKGSDLVRAAQLLEARCEDITYSGQYISILKYTSQIPAELLSQYPRVMMTIAWLLTRKLQFEESAKVLHQVETRIDQLEAAGELARQELRRIKYELLHRRMMLSAARDDAAQVEAQCRSLIDEFSDQTHPYLCGSIYAQLLYARREQYCLNDAEHLQATAQGILRRSNYSFASIALQASIGPSLAFAGKTDAAMRALEQGLNEAIRFGGPCSGLAALPALPLSELLYERNDLDRAEQLITDSLPFATEFGFVDQLMSGFITQARIRQARGDAAGAHCSLDEAMSIAIERSLDRLKFAVVAERLRLFTQAREFDKARRYAADAGIPARHDELLPRNVTVTTALEFKAISWARIAQGDDQLAAALHLIKSWRLFCTNRGALRSLIRWSILGAHFAYLKGDLRTAQRLLREAISQAAPQGLIRVFTDEGNAIRSLLTSTYIDTPDVVSAPDAFATVVMGAFDGEGASKPRLHSDGNPLGEGLYGTLSSKEREVLELVSSGMKNSEVAMKLGMTIGSVKWYLQQVYDKVGTRRRMRAVERARSFGLIA